MSIIVLTPKPNNAAAVPNTDESLSVRLASDFLHMLGQDGRRFETFEQLRDYAQAQIDAAATLAHINAPVVEVALAEPIKPAAEPTGPTIEPIENADTNQA